jgi:hypothetical protein
MAFYCCHREKTLTLNKVIPKAVALNDWAELRGLWSTIRFTHFSEGNVCDADLLADLLLPLLLRAEDAPSQEFPDDLHRS